MDTLYTVSKKQDQKLIVSQITNSLLQNSDLNGESRETIRAFKYDLNQIPYNYTVEVTHRFNGLYLIGRGPKE